MPADRPAPQIPLPHTRQAIGVFDSGVGGLSILMALREELPLEDFVYVADSGFAPYGERDEVFVAERARTITRHLSRHDTLGIKALVIACNTATASAIHLLRMRLP
jgi:glutamate racemase